MLVGLYKEPFKLGVRDRMENCKKNMRKNKISKLEKLYAQRVIKKENKKLAVSHTAIKSNPVGKDCFQIAEKH